MHLPPALNLYLKDNDKGKFDMQDIYGQAREWAARRNLQKGSPKKGSPIVWGEKEEKAFNLLKKALTSDCAQTPTDWEAIRH
jgi:hypothetical protein